MRVNYVLFGSLTSILIIISLISITILFNYSKYVSIININLLSNGSNDEIIIETNSGTVKGYLNQWNDFKVYQFLGIPYAEASVGESRFRIPKLHKWTGVYDANRWPAFCKQINLKQYQYLTPIKNYNTSEDCLYLNIWTPIDINNKKSDNLKPVVVYIHGGVFVYMGTSFDIFDGTVFSSLGDVVFVTVNYRLGVFGFTDTGDYQTDRTNEDFDTNVGLYDQIMALKWIRDNIKPFGGNPNQVTLMGQSAGAISIGLLMSTPLANDLFQRAILESASPMQMKFFFELSANSYKSVLQLTNCSSDEVKQQIDCLRQLSENELNCVHKVLMNDSFLSFAPTIPSLMFGQYPREAFDVNLAENDVLQKQILLGSNAKEGSLFLHQILPEQFPLEKLPELNRKDVYKLIQEFGSGQQNLSESQIQTMFESTLGLRLETPELIRQELSEVMGDFLFKCPVLKFADSLSEWPNVTVYMFYFTERSGHLPEWIGSSHFEEVQFVFGLPLRYPDKYSVKQQEFTRRLIKTWTQFARNGEMLPQLGKVWPKYTSESGQHMELNSDVSSIGVKLNENYYSVFETIFQTFN